MIPTGPGAHSHRGSICNDKHAHAALKSLSGLCMLANRSRALCTACMWLKSAGRSASLPTAFRSTHVSCTASAASPSLRQQSALYSAAAALDYANLGYACICQVRSTPVCRQAAASHDCAQYWPFALGLQAPAIVPAQSASTAPREAVHQSSMPCTVSHQLCASVNTCAGAARAEAASLHKPVLCQAHVPREGPAACKRTCSAERVRPAAHSALERSACDPILPRQQRSVPMVHRVSADGAPTLW
jgi:hypothetical protein